MKLPRHEIPVRGLTGQRAGAGAGKAGRSGPPPSTARAGVMHLRQASAYTYAMRIDGTHEPAFKIGWAFDVRLRTAQFNRASLPGLGGLKYTPELDQYWPTAREAFRMEQALLGEFASLRQRDNSEVVGPLSLNELERNWRRYILTKRRGR